LRLHNIAAPGCFHSACAVGEPGPPLFTGLKRKGEARANRTRLGVVSDVVGEARRDICGHLDAPTGLDQPKGQAGDAEVLLRIEARTTSAAERRFQRARVVGVRPFRDPCQRMGAISDANLIPWQPRPEAMRAVGTAFN
jgi:hypothetical protein